MKVWALFSIENQYDQPDNNLVKLYKDKPSFETLATLLFPNDSFRELSDEQIAKIEKILRGDEARIFDFDYRIEKVEVIE